jgi:hypothetical protein
MPPAADRYCCISKRSRLAVGTAGSIGEAGGLLLIVCGTLSSGAAQGIFRHSSRDTGDRLMGAIALRAAPQLLALSMLLETARSRRQGTGTPLMGQLWLF